ncbi:MAG: GxxExxY protein [Armatimonadota bacterium]
MNLNEQKDPRTYAVIGAAMQVHAELGFGFLEAVHQEALTVEFRRRRIPFAAQLELPIAYRGEKLKTTYRADFVCFDDLTVEIKALAALGGTEEAQLINYLKATGFELGLLLNFGAESLEVRRRIFSKRQASQSAQSVDDPND